MSEGRRKNPERALHRAVAETLRVALTPRTFWTTFPAGGGGRVRGAMLKALGLVPGVPDILLVRGGRAYWIELKAAGGSLSYSQHALHRVLAEVGCRVSVCRSINEVLRQLERWGFEVRASAPADPAGRIAAAGYQ